MPTSPVTNEFMRRLPAALRPNPWNIDEEVMELSANGWTVTDLIQATLADGARQPGHVVAFLRRAKEQPAPMKPFDDRPKTHRICTAPQHEPGCQVCYCNGTEQHMVPTPMPAWFKERFAGRLGRLGMIPDE